MQYEHMAAYLLGDLNARTGVECDYIDVNRHIVETLSIDEYCNDTDITNILLRNDIPLNRVSQDKVINKYGKRFVEMCSNIGILIMNGRCSDDYKGGKCTCDSKSVVDYVACSPELFNHCRPTRFEVLDYDSLISDKHCPVIFNFSHNHDSMIDTREQANSNLCNSESTLVNSSEITV